MPAKVVDASAVAAVLFAEPDGEAVAGRLGADVLVAPRLLEYELGNTCLKKCRRAPALAAELRASLQALASWNLQLHDVDPAGVLALAARHDLTYYDASYLWLARELGLEFVTLDAQVAVLA